MTKAYMPTIEEWEAAQREIARLNEQADQLNRELEYFREGVKFHPRAAKLIAKRKNFVVVADDESNFELVYRLIKMEELMKGTWSDDDELLYQAAIRKSNEVALKEDGEA